MLNQSQLVNIELPGINYNFKIIAGKKGKERIFSIRAVDKLTGRYSSINNLNSVLGELEVDIEDSRYYDSIWIVKNSEIDRLKSKVQCLFKNPCYLEYLEKCLDEDRECGEWENIE